MVSFSIFLLNFNPTIFSNYLQINMITPQHNPVLACDDIIQSILNEHWNRHYYQCAIKSSGQDPQVHLADCLSRKWVYTTQYQWVTPVGRCSQISACRTSSRLQTALLYSQLEVMIAPVKDWSNDFYGTSVFGIDRIIGTDRTILLEAKPITYNKLQSFFM